MMKRSLHSRLLILTLVAYFLCVPRVFAQGPSLSFLTDPDTDLGFASCYIYFPGGAKHKIPFLPVINAKKSPCGSNRYANDIRLNAPIVFVGDGIVRSASNSPYNGIDVAAKVVMLSYDFPDKTYPDAANVTMEQRVREAIERKAAGVVLLSALNETPFPVYREDSLEKIPEIPIILINKRSAGVILGSDGRNVDDLFRLWENEGKFRPSELLTKIDLRMDTKFDRVESPNFTFAFQPGIARDRAQALAQVNERAVSFVLNLFKQTTPHWNKTFTAYFIGYDAKVFYVHHWGKGLSSDAGNFLWFDGNVPEFGLAVHENTHMLMYQNWGHSSSFLNEGIAKYAEAMATDKNSNHRITQSNMREGKLFLLSEMAHISIGSDPRTPVAYPAAGSFVQFLVDKYSLNKIIEIYQRVGSAGEDRNAVDAAWTAVYGKSLNDLEREWLTSLNTFHS